MLSPNSAAVVVVALVLRLLACVFRCDDGGPTLATTAALPGSWTRSRARLFAR